MKNGAHKIDKGQNKIFKMTWPCIWIHNSLEHMVQKIRYGQVIHIILTINAVRYSSGSLLMGKHRLLVTKLTFEKSTIGRPFSKNFKYLEQLYKRLELMMTWDELSWCMQFSYWIPFWLSNSSGSEKLIIFLVFKIHR